MNNTNNFIDLSQIIINIGGIMPALIMLMQAVAGFFGLYLIATGIIELWGSNDPNASKYVKGTNGYSLSSAIINIVIGGLLLAMATLKFVGIVTRTLTGNYVATRMTNADLSYTGGGSSANAHAMLATLAILALLQALGFIAMIKGLMTASGRAKGTAQDTYGKAFVWFIGGVICWNFKFFSDVINNTIGFNIMGLFPILAN